MLEICIRLFFFTFLFSWYCFFVDVYVVSLLSISPFFYISVSWWFSTVVWVTASLNNQKQTCFLADFVVLIGQRVRIRKKKKKTSRKINEILDFVRQLIWYQLLFVNIKLPQRLKKRLKALEIRGKIKAIETTALLRLVKIPRRVQETWGNLLSLRLERKKTIR